MEGEAMLVKNGEHFEVDGFYMYDGHVGGGGEGCFVPRAAYYMYFRKGQRATKLGSCPHDIRWKLISPL